MSRHGAAIALACACLIGGCRSKPAWQGRGDVLAIYRFTTLTAEFPDVVPVPGVVAAAETALRDRGYSITESKSTRDSGVVVAKGPKAGLLEKVTISPRLSDLGTRVSVRIDPLGGEAESRAILDDLLARLGY